MSPRVGVSKDRRIRPIRPDPIRAHPIRPDPIVIGYGFGWRFGDPTFFGIRLSESENPTGFFGFRLGLMTESTSHFPIPSSLSKSNPFSLSIFQIHFPSSTSGSHRRSLPVVSQSSVAPSSRSGHGPPSSSYQIRPPSSSHWLELHHHLPRPYPAPVRPDLGLHRPDLVIGVRKIKRKLRNTNRI